MPETVKKNPPRIDKAYCDRLWAKLVKERAGNRCEACGSSPVQAAHLIPRRWAWTRSDLSNGRALCVSCHRRLDEHEPGFREQVVSDEEYDRLWHEAHDYAGNRFDWSAERERLRDLAKELTR